MRSNYKSAMNNINLMIILLTLLVLSNVTSALHCYECDPTILKCDNGNTGSVIDCDQRDLNNQTGETGCFISAQFTRKCVKKPHTKVGCDAQTNCFCTAERCNKDHNTAGEPTTTTTTTTTTKASPSCFPATSTVYTKLRGDVAMKYLETGDEILSLCENGKPCFLPVHLWLHRSEDVEASFLEVTHEHGTIQLTGKHIIFKLDEKKTLVPVWANTIVVGDRLSLGEKGNTTVLKITEISEAGIYSPLTSSGNIFVDGVLVSCFANIPAFRYSTYKSGMINRIMYGHDIGNLAFSQSSRIIRAGLFSSNNPENGDKHVIAEWLRDTVVYNILKSLHHNLDDLEEEIKVEAGETTWPVYIIGSILDKFIGQDIKETKKVI